MTTVGAGTFSTVQSLPGGIVRKKYQTPHDTAAITECTLLQRLNHPNIIRASSITVDPEGYITVYMPEYPTDLRKAMPVADPLNIIKQLVSAIDYLHRCFVIHRDIKPENILYNPADQTVALCDFNISSYNVTNRRQLAARVVSLQYRAPEISFAEEFCQYGPRIDVWSVGAVSFELITNKPFININTNDSAQNTIDAFNIDFTDASHDTHTHTIRMKIFSQLQTNTVIQHIIKRVGYSTPLIHFVARMLHPDPRRRYTAAEANQVLGETTTTPLHPTFMTTDLATIEECLTQHTIGLNQVTSDAKKLQQGYVRLTWKKQLLSGLNPIYARWVTIVEYEYYKKSGHKRVAGSSDDIDIVSGIIYAISHLTEDPVLAYLGSDNRVSKAADVLRTLEYKLIY